MLDLLYKRRSIRKYKDTSVEKEKIDKIIEAALLSPSGRNRKPWEFVVVDNKELLEKLALSKETGATFIGDAPLAIVVFGDEELAETWIEDTSISLTIIQLISETLGLGSCWVQVRGRKTKDGQDSEVFVKELLNIKNNLKLEAIVAIGYANEIKEVYKKEDLDYSKIKWNRQ